MTPIRFALVLSLLLPLTATAGPTRWLIESTTAGTITSSGNPTLLCGQTSATAAAQTCTAGSCSRSAPNSAASPLEGVDLTGAKGVRIEVCAAAGQTLSGGGGIYLWYYSPRTSAYEFAEDVGLIPIRAAGKRCQVIADFEATAVNVNSSVLVVQASGVTVSGGSALTVVVTVGLDPQLMGGWVSNGC